MNRPAAVDASVAVPLLVATHRAHRGVVDWWAGRELALSGHALAETYAVLTRLPGDLRVDSAAAADLLAARFREPYLLAPETSRRLAARLAEAGVAGGAVYDALVGLAAREHRVPLATRDERARPTYAALGVEVLVAG